MSRSIYELIDQVVDDLKQVSLDTLHIPSARALGKIFLPSIENDRDDFNDNDTLGHGIYKTESGMVNGPTLQQVTIVEGIPEIENIPIDTAGYRIIIPIDEESRVDLSSEYRAIELFVDHTFNIFIRTISGTNNNKTFGIWYSYSNRDWLDALYARINSPVLTGTPTVPDTTPWVSSTQIVNTKNVHEHIENYIRALNIDFVENRWISFVENGTTKYRLQLITTLTTVNHVYRKFDIGEDYPVFRVVDSTVEIKLKSGYIEIVSTERFDGRLSVKGITTQPEFYYSPITSGGNVVALRLMGMYNPDNVTEISTPSSALYNGHYYPVTEIGSYAFAGNYNIISIVFGNGTQIIRSNACSNCTNLVKVFLPSTLRTIEHSVFFNDTNLTLVDLPEGLESIGSSVFYMNKIKEVHIPSTVITIASNPWFNSNGVFDTITVAAGNLRYVVIDNVLYARPLVDGTSDPTVLCVFPSYDYLNRTTYTPVASCTTLGPQSINKTRFTTFDCNEGLINLSSYAFYDGQLPPGTPMYINLSSTVVDISEYFVHSIDARYSVAAGNLHFGVISDVLYELDPTTGDPIRLLKYQQNKTNSSFSTPATVKNINGQAFMNNSILVTLTFSEGVEKLNDSSMIYMPALTTINFPATMRYLGSSIYSIPSLSTITVAAGNPYFTIGSDGVLYRRTPVLSGGAPVFDELGYPSYSGDIHTCMLPPRGISSWSAPSTLKVVTHYAFWGHTNLTTIDFNDCDGVTLSSYCFEVCPNLVNINLNNVSVIQFSAFNGLPVESLTIGAELTIIDAGAVRNCSSLTEVTILSESYTYNGNPFANCPNLLKLKGIAGSTTQALAASIPVIFEAI